MSLSTAEAAVLAAPDDEAAWQVYGDALLAAGDPRGELMAVQRKLAQSPEPALWERERALIAANAAAWLFDGALPLLQSTRLTSGTGAPLDLTWKHGFPIAVKIEGVSYRNPIPFEGLGGTWRQLCSRPENMRFVRRLEFGAASPGSDPDWSEAVEALLEHAPPRLEKLSFDRGDYWDISSTEIGGLDASFWKAMTKLRELHIEIGQVSISDIDAPALQRFSIVTGSLDEGVVGEVTRAKWPQLEHLSLYFGDPNYGGLEDTSSVATLLASTPPPKLKHLGLCNAMFSDELPRLLLESNWLAQLSSLDLSDGTLGDEGAAVLLDAAPQLQRVKLDLSRGYFSDAVIERLRAAFPGVQLDDLQGEAAPEDRYVAVSE